MPPKPLFEELDHRQTPLGDLILRRRTMTSLDNLDVHEIILGNGYLMSSLFTVVEVALSKLGLGAAADASTDGKLDVVVGGLGLGYTARAALENPAVRDLLVVDYLAPVIEWHEKGLVPLGPELTSDPRCRFVLGDFFKRALPEPGEPGFDADRPDRRFHAVLLDIDHSPANLIHERHGVFYQQEGLQRLAGNLHPGGVFALWSDDPPEEGFMANLNTVFATCESHVVKFHNPLLERDSASTVYVAKTHH